MSQAHAARRTSGFDYEDLHVLGKLSRWWSDRLVVGHLKPGSWLDLLAGSKAMLQTRHVDDERFGLLSALDHAIDPVVSHPRLLRVACYVERVLPYRDNTFDNITIVNGLEHCWQAQEIVNESFRILRPSGVLQIIVPTWAGKPLLEFLAFRIRNKQAMLEMNDHKMYYDERDLWPLAVRAGFQPRFIHLQRTKFGYSLYLRATKHSPLS